MFAPRLSGILILLLFLVNSVLGPAICIAQNAKLDSLKLVVESDVPDSLKLKACNQLAIDLSYTDLHAANVYAFKSITYARNTGNVKKEAYGFNDVGLVYYFMGEYDSALYYYGKALEVKGVDQFPRQISVTLCNRAAVFYEKSEYLKAIDDFKEAGEYRLSLNDTNGLQTVFEGLGSIYYDLGDIESALTYHRKTLEIRARIKDSLNMAGTMGNIAIMLKHLGDTADATRYYQQSIQIFRALNYERGIASQQTNLAALWIAEKKYKECLETLEEALVHAQNADDEVLTGTIYTSLAGLHLETKQYHKAGAYLKLAEPVVMSKGKRNTQMEFHSCKHKYLKHIGKYREGLENFEAWVRLDKEVDTEKAIRSVLKSSLDLQYQRKHHFDSIDQVRRDEIAAQKLQTEHEIAEANKVMNYVFGASALLLLGLAMVIFKGYKTKKRDNLTINLQKEVVEEKNKEITDSILYAKRIQSAILPPVKMVSQHLPNSFILYQPKDIVAGDFYWLEQRDNKVLFAAADCTGHGVPGAMVSVICNNGLNRSVREHGITEPGKILDKTREIVIAEFEKSEEEVKDGMDIALCALLQTPGHTQGEKSQLQYAGANNPLWIIRKYTENATKTTLPPEAKTTVIDSHLFIEVKADKQPIGKYGDATPFTTHEIDLQQGDQIYVFTDGFQDQFGGPKGKKFKPSALRKLLLSIAHEPMNIQRQLLENALENWRGELEQIDDVCIIGVRV